MNTARTQRCRDGPITLRNCVGHRAAASQRRAFQDDLEDLKERIKALPVDGFRGTEAEKALISRIRALVDDRLMPLWFQADRIGVHGIVNLLAAHRMRPSPESSRLRTIGGVGRGIFDSRLSRGCLKTSQSSSMDSHGVPRCRLAGVLRSWCL